MPIRKRSSQNKETEKYLMVAFITSIAVIAVIVAFFVPTFLSDLQGVIGAVESLVITIGIIGAILIAMSVIACGVIKQEKSKKRY